MPNLELYISYQKNSNYRLLTRDVNKSSNEIVSVFYNNNSDLTDYQKIQLRLNLRNFDISYESLINNKLLKFRKIGALLVMFLCI